LYKVKKLISEADIKYRVAEMGQEITKDYQKNSEILLIGLLRGSAIFMADLMREVNIEDVHIDFMVVSSYGNEMTSSKNVRVIKDLEEDITGRDIIIVEDIIDTGLTLKCVIELLKTRKPSSIKIATLLNKEIRRENNIKADYIGFEIEDHFIVGYGIDFAQKYRNLKDLNIVIEK